MTASTLIRTVAGVETPATGRWAIAPGQVVTTWRRRWFRCTEGRAMTTGGALVVDTAGVALELEVDGVVAAGRWTVVPSRTGFWDVEGIAGQLHYHGVFRGVDAATAWLTLDARIDGVDLSADLTASAPRGLCTPPATTTKERTP